MTPEVKAFLDDLREIDDESRDRLLAMTNDLKQARAEVIGRVENARLIWAAQTVAPGTVNQAAKIALSGIERTGRLNIAGAVAVVRAVDRARGER